MVRKIYLVGVRKTVLMDRSGFLTFFPLVFWELIACEEEWGLRRAGESAEVEMVFKLRCSCGGLESNKRKSKNVEKQGSLEFQGMLKR